MHVTKDSFTKLLASVQFFYVFSRFLQIKPNRPPPVPFPSKKLLLRESEHAIIFFFFFNLKFT